MNDTVTGNCPNCGSQNELRWGDANVYCSACDTISYYCARCGADSYSCDGTCE